MNSNQLTNELVQALHDYYADRPVDRMVEKLLVEICASYTEGESVSSIARKWSLSRWTVKKVLEANAQHETR